MLQIRNLLVRSLSLTNNELSWEYAQSSEDPLNYTFQIFRSESIGGEFDTLTPTFTNKFYFIDNMLPPPNKWRKLYYKLRVTDIAKAYSQEFGPAFVGYPDNKYALEITRVERLVFKNFAGCKLYILPMKTFGLPCTCWDPVRGKSAKANCSSCFAPGTLVRTEIGYRPIETIDIGDRVLSSDGLFHVVTKTFATPYEGDLIELLPSVSTTPILVTPEHPFLVLRGGHKQKGHCGPKCDHFVLNGDRGEHGFHPDVQQMSSGKWQARVQLGGRRGIGRKALGTFANREDAICAIRVWREEHALPIKHRLEWDDAEQLVRGDWLLSKWPSEIKDIEEISIPDTYRKNGSTGPGMRRLGPDNFLVDSEFLWMVGMYLAEGSCGSRTIRFSLHIKEIEFQNRLLRFFRGCGYHPSIRKAADNGCDVCVNSTSLAEWFPIWLGRGCWNKHIPEELMLLPKDKIEHLLRGIYDGDGEERHAITQTSEILALQISEICHRIGFQSLITRQISKVLTPKGNSRRVAYRTSWEESDRIHHNRKGRWSFKGSLLSQIRLYRKGPYAVNHHRRIPYFGIVYNLEVEGDHTYVVKGVVVHNCYNVGIAGGFNTAIEVYGQVGQMTQQIQSVPAGGMPMQMTGTNIKIINYPLVRSGDLIINPLDNLRYRAVTITSTKLAGHTIHQDISAAVSDMSDSVYDINLNGIDIFQVLDPVAQATMKAVY